MKQTRIRLYVTLESIMEMSPMALIQMSDKTIEQLLKHMIDGLRQTAKEMPIELHHVYIDTNDPAVGRVAMWLKEGIEEPRYQEPPYKVKL